MTSAAQDGLLSPSDIADLAGVSRGAVSNWRKRSADFPAPAAGTASKPLFSHQDVVAWLASRGQKPKQDAGESQVWAVMNHLRGTLTAEQATDLLLTFLVARKTGKPAQGSWPGVDQDVLDQVQGVVGGIGEDQLHRVADYALERLARSAGRSGGHAGFVGSRTSALLANLAAARSGEVLYDPACGIGAALIQAVEKGAPSHRVVGHEINEGSLRAAAQRAELHGVDVELVLTDVMKQDVDPGLAADVVILEPPFGLQDAGISLADPRFEFGTPPASSADTAWVQHAIAHLSPNGRGYVLMPVGTLHRPREAEIRSELLRGGCIEAIVALPGKMLPHTSNPLSLWVLRRPTSGKPAESILLVDAAQAQTPENDVAQWLNKPAVRRGVPHQAVAVSEILAAGAVLTPRRWIGQEAPGSDEIAATYNLGWDSIKQNVEQLKAQIEELPQAPELPKPRVVTINELVDQGVVELLPGRSEERHASAPAGLRERLLTPADVRDNTLRATAPDVSYDDYPDTTRPDDVLVTTVNTIRTIIDPVGGHLPTAGVQRLRVLQPEVLTPAYLAHTLQGDWNGRFLTGATSRAVLRDLEIPLLPISSQNAVQRLIDALAALQKSAHQISHESDDVRASLLRAARYNKDLG